MITIDGADGEGGGQVVRNACALALITGEPFHITNVRARREKPGLMRQHVTALEAACAIGRATCEGLTVGSGEVAFRPGRVVPGEYRFAVGTSGSTALVLQTVLVPLLLADAPSRLVLEGGTHNPAAPPFEFLARAFLPVLRRMGGQVNVQLVRHGFYPRGGGRIEVEVTPSPLAPLDATERGALQEVSACAAFAGLPLAIAEREIATVRSELGWSEREAFARELPAEVGPGNILMLEARFEEVSEVVSGFGQLGVSAERVAGRAATRMAGFLACDAFAGPYLADQLLLPMAAAGGGRFTTVKPSEHTRTSAAVIERFTGRRTSFVQRPGGEHLVTME